MPDFDLSDSGGVSIVLLRGLADLAVLIIFGTAVLRLTVAPAALGLLPMSEARVLRLALRRFHRRCAILAIPILLVWLVFVARSLADATSFPDMLAAVRIVLTGTSYGHVVIGEVAALLLVVAALSAEGVLLDGLALLAASAIILLHACHGHAFSMGVVGLYLVTALHLLAAGGWLGGLPIFAWLIFRLPPAAGAQLSRAFSPVGMVSVLLLAVTALLQGMIMIQSMHNLLTTAYGWTAILKILLLCGLILLASFNRAVATPRLSEAAGAAGGGRVLLLRSLAIELSLGLAVILAAGLLASLPPVMKM